MLGRGLHVPRLRERRLDPGPKRRRAYHHLGDGALSCGGGAEFRTKVCTALRFLSERTSTQHGSRLGVLTAAKTVDGLGDSAADRLSGKS